MPAMIRALAGALLLLLLAGCATTSMGTPGDPLERMNRATHRFNDSVDRAVLRPVAVGYREHVPRIVQTGVNNFLDNLAYTTTIVNDLLQLKIKDTLIDLGRFTVNSTLGLGGILDPATHFGIPRNDEDFGQTLGRWGVPPGPFLMLPLLGPSHVRDLPSNVFNRFLQPFYWYNYGNERWISLGLSIVDKRARLLPLDATLARTYDPYGFIRDAYIQRRLYQVWDGNIPERFLPPQEEDFEEDFEDEPATLEEEPVPDEPQPAEPPPPGGQAD